MTRDIALQVKNVSKSFHLPTEQANGIKQAILNRLKGIKGYKQQDVLKDINFTVNKGDFFGIVGRNGSGKSTLLKIISKIYEPDAGKVIVNGSLVPFIELGVGFNPELTGRDNVYLNGAMLGFSTKEVDDIYDEIVEFAELGEFMDQKLKNYSSGMQVRLAFSVAIKARGDILILDEVLAVGDEAFQRKCFQYFAELKRDKKTVILVTHSMESVQQFCNKAALIDKGHKLEVGSPADIANIYRQLNSNAKKTTASEGLFANEHFSISDVKTDLNKESIGFSFKVNPLSKESKKEDLVLTFVIVKDGAEMVYRYASDDIDVEDVDLSSSRTVNIKLDNIFPKGSYSVQIGVKRRDRSLDFAIFDNIIEYYIDDMQGNTYWTPDKEIVIK